MYMLYICYIHVMKMLYIYIYVYVIYFSCNFFSRLESRLLLVSLLFFLFLRKAISVSEIAARA